MRRAAKESGLNASILIFNTALLLPIISIASVATSDIAGWIGISDFGRSFWTGLTPGLVIFMAVFWGDFVGYWRHRLEHSPLLWPSHAVHHSDTEMTWLTLERFHPINRITTFLIDSTALLALGFPPYAVVANNLVRHYYGYFIHADLPWTYNRWSLVFVSPAMHRWHHAADPRAFDTNFATVFSIFDRIFGTYRVPGPCDVPLGVTDKMAPTLIGQMGYAFTPRAYARVRWPRSNGSKLNSSD
ncbi:sterol desaturase family protein [Aquicoccus sp. SCR17]|nr:sterol desaturase family protein [Carideicomes alvinocaridis]